MVVLPACFDQSLELAEEKALVFIDFETRTVGASANSELDMC